MSLNVLKAAIHQQKLLNPDAEVERLYISDDFHERLKSDLEAVFSVELLSATETQILLIGYPCTFEDMLPDFKIQMSQQ
ncbi:hypothetical protein [Pseudomonas sp. B19125]|uniref:hypothetical protein n=1 Tax=Pseudomonas sp. B19125 TaxID=3235109 RepID=UPI003784DDAF